MWSESRPPPDPLLLGAFALMSERPVLMRLRPCPLALAWEGFKRGILRLSKALKLHLEFLCEDEVARDDGQASHRPKVWKLHLVN